MSYICLWIPDGPTDEACGPELEAALLEVVPRAAVEARGVVWADARGLDGARTAAALLERVGRAAGVRAGAGVAAAPVVARAAAVLAARAAEKAREDREREGGAGKCGEGGERAAAERRSGATAAAGADDFVGASSAAGGAALVVEAGREREFLAPLPVALLEPEPRLEALLDGVGIRTCGELAALTREAVEVRFGPDGARLRRLARADDPYGTVSLARAGSPARAGTRGGGAGATTRRGRPRASAPLFAPAPRERPRASLDFVDYVITDPARLVFTANALLGHVCDALRSRGENARRMAVVLELANGDAWERVIRPARPTADREVWLRLVRALLERLTVPDAVAGACVEARALEPAAVRQGDLFDPGFATASAVEAALARIIEERGAVVVEPDTDAHPLAERRTEWVARGVEAAETDPAERGAGGDGAAGGRRLPGRRTDVDAGSAAQRSSGRSGEPRLALQLLPEPRPVRVEAARRRDHHAPNRLHDGRGWRRITAAAGPDRVSGGQWEEEPYAREYFRCVTDEGALVWLYRDAREDAWYLHGWWD